ncbi:DUF2169 family type VI secretion system accessory protein [Polyangium jinanense]|uniref:DUF2169 domain-containing protein n=1 Tax=Polyangium jinanense TaxID=2829994 RepID=A0A9X3X4Q1_9BACT|nr:DUF2169 domain-containing protein [Polyangium jinanense]MDC3955571.1 DUF2169 domain-containing protein [Polyangium jinanense]MDC3982213.1 DUF2169 domain-containing protein [Polyangium jinanense]
MARNHGFSNASRLAADAVPYRSSSGGTAVIALVKATFVVPQPGAPAVLQDAQPAVRINEVLVDPDAPSRGEESSIRYPSDIGLKKPGADLLIVGDAVPRTKARAADVAVRAKGRTVTLRVHGDRAFVWSPMGLGMSVAAMFERAPVTYERAYGGRSADGTLVDWRNPVGRGVHRNERELDGKLAPCIEDPGVSYRAGQDYLPYGFGALATHWTERKRHAGTFDAGWQRTRMPLPPEDFLDAFFHVAPPALRFEEPFSPGDPVAVLGMSEAGLFNFTVPRLVVKVFEKREDGKTIEHRPRADLLLVEPERSTFELTFREVLRVGRGPGRLREVRVDVD